MHELVNGDDDIHYALRNIYDPMVLERLGVERVQDLNYFEIYEYLAYGGTSNKGDEVVKAI